MGSPAPARTDASALMRMYGLITDSLLHPRDRERDGEGRVLAKSDLPTPVAGPLGAFHREPESGSARHYLETLELAPVCPLYVGAHLFEEPETCREAGSSDRNPYLVSLRNLYRHFGFEVTERELPDFLPLMVDFLRLTADETKGRDASIRRYFVEKLLAPGLDPLEDALEEAGSPYSLVIRALRAALRKDLERTPELPTWEPPSDVDRETPEVGCGERLADVEPGQTGRGG